MKRLIVFTAFVAVICLSFAGTAKADSTSAGGVVYTFTNGEADGGNVFDIVLTIDTTGATASGTLSSFSVQFTGASSVTLETVSGNAGSWSVLGQGPNTAGGCNINGSADHWCDSGSAISVASGGPGDVYTFTYEVNMGSNTLPTESHIQAFQGQGDLAISNDVGIGVPEPGTLALLGFGLVGVPFLRRRKK